MTACREQIMAAVESAIGAISGITGFSSSTVERERARPVTALPFACVFEGDEGPAEDEFTGSRAYTLLVDVELYVTGATPKAAAQALSALRAKADMALLADVTLGGKARDIRVVDEPPPVRNVVDGHPNHRATARRFAIDYAHLENDPETFS